MPRLPAPRRRPRRLLAAVGPDWAGAAARPAPARVAPAWEAAVARWAVQVAPVWVVGALSREPARAAAPVSAAGERPSQELVRAPVSAVGAAAVAAARA